MFLWWGVGEVEVVVGGFDRVWFEIARCGGRQGVARLAIHVGLRGECRVGRN